VFVYGGATYLSRLWVKVSRQEERQIRKEGREEKGKEKTEQMEYAYWKEYDPKRVNVWEREEPDTKRVDVWEPNGLSQRANVYEIARGDIRTIQIDSHVRGGAMSYTSDPPSRVTNTISARFLSS
jgi:hypothetical protein